MFFLYSALGVLKDLVALQKNLLEPVFYAVKRFELSFYRNQLIHLFIHEAIVAVTMYTRIKIGGAKSIQQISQTELLDEVTFLSRLLKTDFIYNPGDIESNLENTLEYLKVSPHFKGTKHPIDSTHTLVRNGPLTFSSHLHPIRNQT